MKKLIGILVVVVLVAAAGAAAWFYLWRGGASEPAAQGPQEQSAVAVSFAEVGQRTLESTVRGVGSLQAMQRVELRPEIDGVVNGIHFEEGRRVEQGDLLFELDDAKLQRQLASREAALRATRARLDNAERTFNRLSRLHERGVTSSDEFDQARADYESALADVDELEADVQLVQEELRDTRIHAPFTGMISAREVDLGAYVSANDLLATLYQVSELEIAFSLPERYASRIHLGQPVDITVAAHPGRVFEGTIGFISPQVNPATRDIRVKARVDNRDGALRPGAFATASVIVERRADRPVVPAEAMVSTRRGYMVFVVDEDGRAHQMPVRPGLRENGWVEIIEGVTPGQRIVRMGHMRLNDGSLVRAAEGASGAPETETETDVEAEAAHAMHE